MIVTPYIIRPTHLGTSCTVVVIGIIVIYLGSTKVISNDNNDNDNNTDMVKEITTQY